MIELGIDLETYSSQDIKAGVHKYCEAPDFEILMLAYKFTDEPVELIDLKCYEKLPARVLNAINDPNILKTAYNAAFEIACLSRHLGYQVDHTQWSCTQALGAQVGLPFGLDAVATVLKTGNQKNKDGKEHIKYFSIPCKPTKVNGQRTRNLPHHNYSMWLDFREYCKGDVLTEQDIRQQLKWFTPCDFEKPVWNLDQKINNTGVQVDLILSQNAIDINDTVTLEDTEAARKLTGLLNPGSAAQMKTFIKNATGEDVPSLNKQVMPDIKAQFKNSALVMAALKAYDKLGRTSITKYAAIINSACTDSRIRGLFQYYGANRTGRFAGRNVQVHNLKRNDVDDLSLIRHLVRTNQLAVLKLMYDDVGHLLSNLIRTAFVPAPGEKLIPADFSAIEARIIAWLAGEEWRMEVFRTHGKIYEASASQMFKVPIDTIKKGQANFDLRYKGKIAELALGYQGGAGALINMGALRMGLTEEELPGLVTMWRRANKKIVKFWYDVQAAAVTALTEGPCQIQFGIKFKYKDAKLFITLPSGRDLIYINARVTSSGNVTYDGLNQTTKVWGRQDTYGGKFVENIVQAIARDVLVDAMIRVDAAGFKIVMHVHDEIVVEAPAAEAEAVAKQMSTILGTPIAWAPGLPLGSETFIADYYKK